jgi:hypothetical protein
MMQRWVDHEEAVEIITQIINIDKCGIYIGKLSNLFLCPP